VNSLPYCAVHQDNCCKTDQFKVWIYTLLYPEPVRERAKYKDAVTSGTDVSDLAPKLGKFWDQLAAQLLEETQEAQARTPSPDQQAQPKAKPAKKKTMSIYLDQEHLDKLDELEAAFLSRHLKIYRNDIIRHLIQRCSLDELLRELNPEKI
jgi:hypothetical protein